MHEGGGVLQFDKYPYSIPIHHLPPATCLKWLMIEVLWVELDMLLRVKVDFCNLITYIFILSGKRPAHRPNV